MLGGGEGLNYNEKHVQTCKKKVQSCTEGVTLMTNDMRGDDEDIYGVGYGDSDSSGDSAKCGGVDACSAESCSTLPRGDQDEHSDEEHDMTTRQGQQRIKSYFKVRKAKAEPEGERPKDEHDNLKTSDIVVTDEGRKQLIAIGNDVVGLFPSMKEVNTGRAVGRQVFKSPMTVMGLDYKEITRYVAGSRRLCGDLSEVENVLPWRRKAGKGGVHPGMQSKEMKGKKRGLEEVWQFPKATPTDYQKRVLQERPSYRWRVAL